MPLIHDNPWLIDQLLQIVANDESKKLTKKAQTPPVDNQQQVADALRAVMQNLQNQITPGRGGGGGGGVEHSGASVALGQQNMDSMGDFIEWLNANQTKFNGKQIVFAASAHPQSPGEDYDYVKIEPGTKMAVVEGENGTARPTAPNRAEVAYWVQIEALKSYLVALQRDPDIQAKPTSKLQLLNLIRFSNEQLDTNLSEQYKEETKDEEVDSPPQTLDMSQWAQPGTKPLWLHDLKDINTLNAWFGSNPMTAVKVGNHPPQTMRDQHWNRCAAINVLAARARSLQGNAVPESKARAAAYVTAINTIAKSINCQISTNSDAWGDDSGAGGDESGGQGGAPMTLEELASMQVFNARFIDVRVIKQFVDNYAAWGAANKNSNAVRLKADFDGAVSQGQTAVRNLMSPIMLSGVDRQQFTNLYTTNASYFTLAINHLASIVSSAQRALQDFIVVYSQNHGGMAGSAAQNLNRQVAIAQQNINDLMRIQSQPQPTPPYRR